MACENMNVESWGHASQCPTSSDTDAQSGRPQKTSPVTGRWA